MATDLTASRFSTMRKRAGLAANKGGYTYDEVKAMLREKGKPYKRADPRKAEALKKMLQNDGY